MVLLSVTVLLGGAVLGAAATSLCLHHGCPMCGSCIVMGWVPTVQDSSWYL